MSELIERMARDFAEQEGWNWDDLLEMEDTSFGWGRNHIRQRIHSALAAAREPTEAMVIAGSNKDMGLCAEDVRLGWQAMIDAELQD